ncbi:MAG: hypothetical protein DMG79_16965 [Acidobacteria bacterium]|nr:MAG: hypothetical protein DMG79_16965 [Acidobacteriota bacterium]
MQFWFARGSEVSIREQLVTQVVLGILSDDLAPGQRLPSTRDLARRFHLHPNTISAGYRQLARDRWVEFRRGSGVYVRASKPEVASTPSLAVDQMIARLGPPSRQEPALPNPTTPCPRLGFDSFQRRRELFRLPPHQIRRLLRAGYDGDNPGSGQSNLVIYCVYSAQ